MTPVPGTHVAGTRVRRAARPVEYGLNGVAFASQGAPIPVALEASFVAPEASLPRLSASLRRASVSSVCFPLRVPAQRLRSPQAPLSRRRPPQRERGTTAPAVEECSVAQVAEGSVQSR